MKYERHEIARFRNWNKARIMGMTYNTSGFAPSEIPIMKEIYRLRDELLNKWDERSKNELKMNVKPRK